MFAVCVGLVRRCYAQAELLEGHRFAYVHGVLHRDISAGNLLIAPMGSGASSQPHFQGIRGCLIDFGHAKRIQIVSERKISFKEIDTPLLPMYLEAEWRPRPGQVSEAVVQRALHCFKLRNREPRLAPLYYIGHIVSYIHAAWHYHKSSGLTPPVGNVYTPEDFGWNTALLVCYCCPFRCGQRLMVL